MEIKPVVFDVKEGVDKVDVHEWQQKRCALSDEEFARLLYLMAAYTGLRLNELRQLAWLDLNLDPENGWIKAREGATKNGKAATIPLHPELAKELKVAEAERKEDQKEVFVIPTNSDRTFRKDLERAGIERINTIGRKVDFHALRYTFATNLASQGAPQRLAQDLMRHSDPKLTAMLYTDSSQLPTFDAVRKLT